MLAMFGNGRLFTLNISQVWDDQMPKSTIEYWNPLIQAHKNLWKPIPGLEEMVEELTLSIDTETGEYTRLTRFYPGADTSDFGVKSHPCPEEIFIVSGRLFDSAFDLWLETGHYASRPPGELHGPFKTDVGCVVLEISFPDRVSK
jgi:ChrR Cupin-like domain